MKKPNNDAANFGTMGSCRAFRRQRSVIGGVLLALVAASAEGCAAPAPVPSMSLTESRERMLALVDATAAALSKREWREASGATLQGCLLNGTEGHNLTYVRGGRASSDPERDAAIVREFWESEGYETRVGRSSNTRDISFIVRMQSADVKFLRYSVSDGYSGFTAESVCLPGTSDEV